MDDGTLAFVMRALALKDVPRQGWFRVGVARPESVADHSWGMALLAVVLARERGLDAGRVVELCVVHDVAEAVVGDLVPGEYASKPDKLARERAGLAEMLADAPPALRARFLADFDELASSATPEAAFVHELDKLEMGLQARRYEAQGLPREKLEEFVASARAGVKDAALKRALD
jgi:putative hydrolase of HD superfamily